MNLLLQASICRTKVLTVILICLFVLPGSVNTVFAANPAMVISGGKSVAARINITGTVKDAKGEPLVGVTVRIKGTKSGTSTDVNGVYRLNLPVGNETLVFTYVGFLTKEVVAKGISMDVRLEESSSNLDEVVVVGYGTQRKATLTGAISTINMSAIEDLPVSNLGAALAGRILGVGVSGGVARPGSAAKITVRNPNTYFGKDGGSTEPLFVIDDIVQIGGNGQPDATLFNNLDPSEIESISVLKDASAAIYGSRAGNGVVLVKTKRGKEGKPRISYSGSYAINDEAYRTKMMSAYEFGQYYNIMNGPNGADAKPGVNNFFSQDELDHFKTIDNNWLTDAWSPAFNTRHTLSMSGGAERATYFGDVSYFKQDGNLNSLDFNRWNFRAGSDVNVAANLKVGLQVSGNNSDLTKTFNKIGGENEENDYRNLLLTPRYIPMYIDGLPVKIPGTTNDLSMYHFYEIQKLGNLAQTDSKTFTVNLYAEYNIPFVKGLKAKASYGSNNSSSRGSQIGTKYTLYEFNRLGENQHIYEGATLATSKPISASNGNRLYYANTTAESYQTNFLLNYNRQFGKHNVSGLFTVEKSESETNQESVYRESPFLTTNGQFATASGDVVGATSAAESGSLSYIGRANYSYADKYLAEILFRTDASTKFAPENYWGKFYSGSLGWVLSEEDFFKVEGIDFLKLRYSFGLLGNDQTKPWLWRQRYTYQDGKGAVFGGNTNTTTGMKMEASPSPDAHWTTEFKNNVGLDAQFLRSRLSATMEGYYNKASEILIERTGNVPVTVGGSVASENYGKADYYGLELELGWNDKIGNDFRYGVSTRYSFTDNKVIQMNFNDTDIMYPWNAQPNHSNDNGMWGYDNLGMFKSQAEIDTYVSENNIISVFETPAAQLKPGMLYYSDVRGALQSDGSFAGKDGIINDNDQIKLSNRKDNHHGYSLTLKAGYKGLNIDCVIGGSFGGWSEIDARKKLNNSIARAFQSLPNIWGDIYDPELNPTGTMPNPNWQDISLTPASNFWKVSSFRMRMTNFNVNYTIPKKVVDYLKVSNARVYFTGLNPMNLYNPYSYRDSDTAYDVFPNLRTYSFGINLTL
ncbi:SusC/RagA family TonB-linked outer membrane protein [Arcticibacter eurypsychrophilus]|uniref:SusC/RagA family TonB-linked outer membrane protein n=1 Tax=Arcticibacter eurypsychrophilus TaxID=1434752 RepID=UPI00084CE8B2|nr:TonB-dependent receptor [Arcticibacter eurypsychrophilus]